VLANLKSLVLSPCDIVGISANFLETLGETRIAQVILEQVLPVPAKLDESCRDITNRTLPSELAILDALIPQVTSESGPGQAGTQFDSAGRSSLGRGLEAVIAALTLDRTLVQTSAAHLLHCLTAYYAAADETAVLNASRGVYKSDTAQDYLYGIREESDQLISYWIVSVARSLPDSWHMAAPTAVLRKGPPSDDILYALQSLASSATESSDIALRGLRDVLVKLLRATDVDNAVLERWLTLAQSVYSTRTWLVNHCAADSVLTHPSHTRSRGGVSRYSRPSNSPLRIPPSAAFPE
jgi:hypothetical protein